MKDKKSRKANDKNGKFKKDMKKDDITSGKHKRKKTLLSINRSNPPKETSRPTAEEAGIRIELWTLACTSERTRRGVDYNRSLYASMYVRTYQRWRRQSRNLHTCMYFTAYFRSNWKLKSYMLVKDNWMQVRHFSVHDL